MTTNHLRKPKQEDVDEIVWRYYEGYYGEHSQDIDILLTHIEHITNRLMTAKEKIYSLNKLTPKRIRQQ